MVLSESAFPGWVELLLKVGGLFTPIIGFLFGRVSKSSADAVRLDNVEKKQESMQIILNDTVVTVSNHGQSIRVTDSKLNELDSKVNTANIGIATLLERTTKRS